MILWFIGTPTAASEALADHLQRAGIEVQQAASSKDLDSTHPCLQSEALVLTEVSEVADLQHRLEGCSIPALFVFAEVQQGLPPSCTVLNPETPLEAQQARLLEGRAQTSPSRLQINQLVLDRVGKTTRLNNELIDLTDLEFEILWVLAEQAGRVVSSVRLLSQVWGLQHDPQSNRVAVYVKRLRSKLPKGFIQTQRGKGYRLQA